jgi:hypothetical protein
MAVSPSTSNYLLGRGILYIGVWSGSTPPSSYDDVGNCPRFEVEVTEETLDHYSSRSGTREKDKTVILESGYTVNFDLDEVSIANLQKFLKGTLDGEHIILANTALTEEYGLRFISDNPAGPNTQEKWEFWRVKLSPGGSFGLIADEWALLTFTGEGLSDSANHSTSPFFSVTYGTTTTT